MKVFRESIETKSAGMRPTFTAITDQVKDIVQRSGIKEGICVVYSHHTTCSIMMQEASFDMTYTGLEYLQQDLCDVFENIIPTCRKEGQYMHPGPKLTEFSINAGETKPETLNTDGHLRSVFLGRSETIVLINGELDMGEFGHIYFVDLDQTRPRARQAQVQVIGE
jgi:secondary thiamine-phosphate synthase enzyme